MELTIEQKQRRSITQKQWRENNPDRVKELNNQYKNANKDKLKEYFTNYYQENREHMRVQQKEYRDNNVYLDAVYFFMYDDEVSYIGSSARFKERISAHCTANSNLKMSAEEMAQSNLLNKILYKEFNEYNLNRDDLYFIEQFEKDRNNEILGKNKVYYKEENLSRSKEELIKITNQAEVKEFEKLDRYLN